MAGPKVFVPGPSVNTGLIGSPAEYMRNIQAMGQNLAKNKMARDELEMQEANRQALLALEERRVAHTESADARARAEELRKRTENNRRAQGIYDIVSNPENAAYVNELLTNPDAIKIFDDLNISDPTKRKEKVLEFTRKNPSLMRDPQQFFDTVYRGALSLNSTDEEARTAATRAVSDAFPTISSEAAGKLMQTSGGGLGGLTSKLFGGKSTGGQVQSNPSLADEEEFKALIGNRINIENSRGGGFIDSAVNFFNIGDPTRDTFDFFARDLDMQDIETLDGVYGNDFPAYALMNAVRSSINIQDGTIGQRKWRNIIDNPDSQDAKDFRKLAQAHMDQAERRNLSGRLGGLNIQDVVALDRLLRDDVNRFNMDVLSRTAPQASTLADRLAGFRNFVGVPAPVTAQAPQAPVAPPAQITPQADTAPPVVTPAPAPAATGSSTLDKLIQAASADPQTAEFPIGQPGVLENIGSVFEAIGNASTAPARIIGNTLKPIIDEGFSLPQGQGILGQPGGPAPEPPAAQQQVQEARVDEQIFMANAELNAMPAPSRRTPEQKDRAAQLEKLLKQLQDLRRE